MYNNDDFANYDYVPGYDDSYNEPYYEEPEPMPVNEAPQHMNFATVLEPGEKVSDPSLIDSFQSMVSNKNKAVVRTAPLRIVSHSLFEPVDPNPHPSERFLVGKLYAKVIIPKADKKTLKALDDALQYEKQKFCEKHNVNPSQLNPRHVKNSILDYLDDGDTFEKDKHNRFKNAYVLTAKTNPFPDRPSVPVFDLNGNLVSKEEGLAPEDKIQMILRYSPWTRGMDKGIGMYLQEVRFVQKGKYHREPSIGFNNFE